jgi:hypothetical protein
MFGDKPVLLGFTHYFRERRIDAGLAAILPVKDSAGGLNGPRRRSSRGAKPKRTPTGVADSPLRGLENTAEARRDFVTERLTLTDSGQMLIFRFPVK